MSPSSDFATRLLLFLIASFLIYRFSFNPIVLSLVLYPIITTVLRPLRLRRLKTQYPTPHSLQTMTLQSASLIQKSLAEREFPFTFNKALQFALFRTYGIPSISALLLHTRQLSDPSAAFKRYTDTSVLVGEILGQDWGSERWAEGMARMNWIHSGYVRGGKIKREDMLYTLGLFACEPVRWIEAYEWRSLDPIEECALGVFWRGVGEAMDIGYEGLKGQDTGAGWKDGREWMEDVKAWVEAYERKEMRPDEGNKALTEKTVAILLWGVPAWAKGAGSKVVSVLMGDRLREAMMFEKPSRSYFTFVDTLLAVRKFCLRYLALPRPSFLSVVQATDKPSEHGTYYMTFYEAMPYYVKPTVWNRWGPSAWVGRAMGLPVPGDEGDKYFPRGFKAEEVGPAGMHGKGVEGFRREKEALEIMERQREKRGGGCPFGMPLA